ncbi:MAG: ABC transporter ATP-binding protein [Aggregatilineales bacterium]
MSTDTYDLKQAVTDRRLLGLWRLLTGYRLTYAGANLSLAVSAAAKTSTFLLLAYLVDSVLEDAASLTLERLALIAFGFVALAVVEGFFTFQSGRLAAHAAESVALRLRNYMFDHLQRLTFTYHSSTSTGELIQRATSDVEAIRRFLAEQAIGVGRILALFVINFAALLLLHAPLALFSVIVVPVTVTMSFFFFRKVSEAYEAFQEQDAVLSKTLQENLTGVRVVKAFARQPYEIEKFDRENWKHFLLGRRLLRMHAFYWPISDILGSAQMVAGMVVGALLVINGEITLGTYVAYTGMVVRIIWPMRELGRLIVDMSTGLVSYKRVTDILKQEREPIDDGLTPETNLRGEVVFDRVWFSYDDGQPVLQDISFACQPGQAVALLGSTGSGKTSLVNLLPRFYEYTQGSVRLDGVELKTYSRRYLRQQIGIIEQEPFLFSRTIRDNITYGVGREVSDSEVEAAARAAAVHDVIMSFPEGYNTLVGERGVTLSGGQKQRVALARTLLKDPRILILDDSTSSVDTETESQIRTALRRLMQNRTTFIIAHRVQSLMTADLILVMDQGRIVQRGTHAELIAQPGIYQQVYDVQARIEDELEKEVSGV